MTCLWGIAYRKKVLPWLDKDKYCLMKYFCFELFYWNLKGFPCQCRDKFRSRAMNRWIKEMGLWERKAVSVPSSACSGQYRARTMFWTEVLSPTELNIIRRGLLVFLPQVFKQRHSNVGQNAVDILILKDSENYFWLLDTQGLFFPIIICPVFFFSVL